MCIFNLNDEPRAVALTLASRRRIEPSSVKDGHVRVEFRERVTHLATASGKLNAANSVEYCDKSDYALQTSNRED